MWDALWKLLFLASTLEVLYLFHKKNAREEVIKELQFKNMKLENERQAERKGRIKAQKELRDHLRPINEGGKKETSAYPLTPVGHIRSCFSKRSGTPRQPLLVTKAKSSLSLPLGGVSPAVFEGLSDYSHCWLLYIFHENTDLTRLWKDSPHKDFKAKISVPRLNGGKLGVFATRSPHRPVPLGLSMAKIEKVTGRTLYLSGSDLVDGTPILDVKPYLPFCDSVPEALVPSWINTSGEEDPLFVSAVKFSDEVEVNLELCWENIKDKSLYDSKEDLRELVFQVLSRDIRSVFQRQGGKPSTYEGQESKKASVENPCFSLVLEGVQFDYRVDDDDKSIHVFSATVK